MGFPERTDTIFFVGVGGGLPLCGAESKFNSVHPSIITLHTFTLPFTLLFRIYHNNFISIQGTYLPVTNSNVPPTCIRSVNYFFKVILCVFGGVRGGCVVVCAHVHECICGCGASVCVCKCGVVYVLSLIHI